MAEGAQRMLQILEGLRRIDVSMPTASMEEYADDACMTDPEGKGVVLTDADFWWLAATVQTYYDLLSEREQPSAPLSVRRDSSGESNG